MSTKLLLLPALLLAFGTLTIISCDSSTGPEETHEFPDAIDSVATDLTLYVYSMGGFFICGNKISSAAEINAPVFRLILDTLELPTEGPITLDIPDHDYYVVYAQADGFYTEIYECAKGVEYTIDLDAIPQVPYSITGVIFEEGVYFTDTYYSNDTVALTLPGGHSIIGTTDSLGRYGFSNLSESAYILHFSAMGLVNSFEIYNTPATNYRDFYYVGEYMVEAPNIYLYPETTLNISVDLEFPSGGKIVHSEPQYNDGWDVTVTPDGLIDGRYDYLFYEVSMTAPFSTSDGWLLDGANISNEFKFILANLGYYDNEIDDFLEYWLPRLNNSPWYAVFPQNVESMITVTIDPRPDEFLRSIFVIVPVTEPMALTEPPMPDAIRRHKFSAVEWGAILLNR